MTAPALRLLPDVLRVLRRLAADRELPGAYGSGLAGVGYVVLLIDLIPDFILALGFADDALIVAVAAQRRAAAGPDALARHWPGTPNGPIAALWRARVSEQVPNSAPPATGG